MNTGIQRVVRNVVNHIEGAPQWQGWHIQPVVISHGRLLRISPDQLYPQPAALTSEPTQTPPVSLAAQGVDYARGVYYALLHLMLALAANNARARRFLFAPKHEMGVSGIIYRLLWPLRQIRQRLSRPGDSAAETADHDSFSEIGGDDVLLLLDSSWHCNIWPSVDRFKENGAQVVAVIYDLIPISHPQFCDASLVGIFQRWFEQAVTRVDGYVAISDTVRQHVQGYLQQHHPQHINASQFSYFWLGSDFSASAPPSDEDVDPAIRQALMNRPTYILVSTIEPRKNHSFLLDAFDLLWEQGVEVNLAFIGKPGWKVERLLTRIRRHPQANKRLFQWQGLSDAALQYCYQHARMLVFPSQVEGFGLPIIESLANGLPVLASDTPIHREVGGEHIGYFPLDTPQGLASQVADIERFGLPDHLNVADDYQWLSWQESTTQLSTAVWQVLAPSSDSA